MATELRRVIFSNEEVIKAIKSYNEMARKRLPEGSIVTCRINGGDGLKLTLEMQELTTSKPIGLRSRPRSLVRRS